MDDKERKQNDEKSTKKVYEKPCILKKGKVVLIRDCHSLMFRPRPK